MMNGTLTNPGSIEPYLDFSLKENATVLTTSMVIPAIRQPSRTELEIMSAKNRTNDPMTTATQPNLNSFYFYKAEQFAVLWVSFTVIVVGNLAVLVALSLNKTRKSRMNFFIRQLAIADLSVGLSNVSVDIAWRITIAWYAGNILCKVIRFLQAVVTYSSTYVSVALSIDRYDAITHPMNFSGSWKRAKVLILLSWTFSVIFSIPALFSFGEKPIEDIPQCWIDLNPTQWKIYMTSVAILSFVIPALVITTCYAIIVWTIWSKSKPLLSTGHATIKRNPRGRNTRQRRDDQESRRASSRGSIPRAKIKTVKMTFVIVFVFVVCWSPYIFFDLLQVYGYIPKTQHNIAVATFIQSLAPLNSAANPVIYCLFSTHLCRNSRKYPPMNWITTCIASCFPGIRQGRCYRSGDPSSTMTTTITQSSRRSGSAVSSRQTIRLQQSLNAQKVSMSVV